ncbi:hypothetical protein J4711_13455 [Staphylococcus epidermidis]|nr:hypothetical protein [Staphylococcus epidermidis]
MHIALTGLLGYRPDLVVSGINNGANKVTLRFTRAPLAAMEGYLLAFRRLPSRRSTKAGRAGGCSGHRAPDGAGHAKPAVDWCFAWLLNEYSNMPLDALKSVAVPSGRRHSLSRPWCSKARVVRPCTGSARGAADDSEGTDFHAGPWSGHDAAEGRFDRS